MYSPKRRLRLFRDSAFSGPTITDTTVYTYSWLQQSSAPSQRYAMFDVDDTGDTMVSTRWTSTSGQQGPYISTNKGATWSRKVTGITLGGTLLTHSVCVARSSPLIMYATTSPTTGSIYKSTDGGNNWVDIGPLSASWNGIKCNSTGTIVVAAASTSYLYKSTNGGATWSAMTGAGTPQWDSVFVSDDGLVIVGCAVPGNLQVSRNGGTSWSSITTVGLNRLWRGISGSTDGKVLFACSSGSSGRPVLSTDYGVTWSAVSFGSATVSWWNTAVSINGNKLLTAQSDGYIYVSQDGGSNWTSFTSSPGLSAQSWEGLAMTPDGKTMIVGVQGSDKPWVATGT